MKISERTVNVSLILWTLFLLGLYGAVALYQPQSIYPDSAWGFLTLKGMQTGAPFNHRILPDPGNISQNIFYGNSWWSPGQYLIPWLISLLLGCDLGKAIWLTTVFSGIVALSGYYILFRKIGFCTLLALICTAFIASMRYFALSFSVYHGGDQLLFAALPWIMTGVVRMRHLPWKSLPVMAGLFLFGTFCKMSFMVYSVSICVFLIALRFSFRGKRSGLFTQYLIRISLLFCLYVAAAKIIFLGYGYSIPETMGAAQWDALPVFASPAFSFSSGMSFMDLLKGLHAFTTGKVISNWAQLWPVIVLTAMLSFVFWLHVLKNSGNTLYKILLTSFFISASLIMMAFYVTGAKVGLDERHFRVTGILFLPAIFLYVSNLKKPLFKVILILFLIVQTFYGPLSFIYFEKSELAQGAVGKSGFLHRATSEDDLLLFHSLDLEAGKSNSNLILVPQPSLALEFEKARVLPVNINNKPLDEMPLKEYRGTVDNLIVVMQKEFEGTAREQAVLSSFSDYDQMAWMKYERGNYLFFAQGKRIGEIMAKCNIAKVVI